MDKFMLFFNKNKRYLGAGAVGICMAILLAFGVFRSNNPAGGAKGGGKAVPAAESVLDDGEGLTAIEKDTEIGQLITGYYDAYASNDIKTLEKLAKPVSDYEKSYIAFMSEFIEKYEVVDIYGKYHAGGENMLISVHQKLKFKDIDSAAPGADFFYVEKGEDGKYFINNLYSNFNIQSKEQDMMPEVTKAIAEYEQLPEVVDLQNSIQSEYNEIDLNDKELSKFITSTLKEASAKWSSDYKKAEKEKAKKEEKEKKKAEEEKKKAEEEEKKKAEEEAKQAEEEEKAEEEEAKQAEEEKTEEKDSSKSSKYLYATGNVNLRKKPNTDSKVVLTLKRGKKLLNLGEADGWTKVSVSGRTGYIRNDLVAKKRSETFSAGDRMKVKETINIRKKKSTSSEIVVQAYGGDKITIIRPGKSWTRVSCKDKKGYIKTELLE